MIIRRLNGAKLYMMFALANRVLAKRVGVIVAALRVFTSGVHIGLAYSCKQLLPSDRLQGPTIAV